MAGNRPSQESSPTMARAGLWVKRVLQVLVIIVLMDAILFGAAGRIDWAWAWLWTFMYSAFLLVFVFWSTHTAPGLLEERGRVAANVKIWDKAILSMYTVLLLALLVVAGVDAGRFGWSVMPSALHAVGLIGLSLSGGLIWWATSANRFLSRWARIQDDRGHAVATGGPYRYVRHPMYAALISLMISLALELGSYWALVPAVLIGVLYVIRTALEDRMLCQELPGYREYAERVRYRLLPGVW